MGNKNAASQEALAASGQGWGVIAATFWAILVFIGPSFLLSPLVPWLVGLPLGQNGKTFVEELLLQLTTLGLLALVLKAYRVGFKSLGFQKFAPRYLWWVVGAFPIYAIVSLIISAIIAHIFPVNLQEPQDVGYKLVHGPALVGVFFALVVITPVVEETIFRGFLFGAYRRRFGFAAGSILVSALFAAAHAQVNVGLDVFALSLFLCYLREKTRSIWPSILLHGVKNLVAFFLLFIMGMQ